MKASPKISPPRPCKDDAYAFIFDQQGLMASLSIEGTKISRIKIRKKNNLRRQTARGSRRGTRGRFSASKKYSLRYAKYILRILSSFLVRHLAHAHVMDVGKSLPRYR